MKLNFKSCICTTEWSFYENHALCLALACCSARPSANGRFIAAATTSSELRLEADEIMVKTQGEHVGLVAALIEGKVVLPYWTPVYLGATADCHARCRLTDAARDDASNLT
ncbi:MAG: hypothetical protein ACT4PZ_24560 [Panacagrimonas sp.]